MALHDDAMKMRWAGVAWGSFAGPRGEVLPGWALSGPSCVHGTQLLEEAGQVGRSG